MGEIQRAPLTPNDLKILKALAQRGDWSMIQDLMLLEPSVRLETFYMRLTILKNRGLVERQIKEEALFGTLVLKYWWKITDEGLVVVDPTHPEGESS